MLQRLAAESISRKVIRLFPPGTTFLRIVPQQFKYIPDSLSSNVAFGLKFQEPRSADWQNDHGRAGRALKTRASMTLKAWRMNISTQVEK